MKWIEHSNAKHYQAFGLCAELVCNPLLHSRPHCFPQTAECNSAGRTGKNACGPPAQRWRHCARRHSRFPQFRFEEEVTNETSTRLELVDRTVNVSQKVRA